MIPAEIIVEVVIGTLASVLIAILLLKMYSLKKDRDTLMVMMIQANIDKNVVSKKLEDTLAVVNNTNIEDKDGFIRFLSQSREWAFGYIEDVQGSIKNLSTAMDSGDEAKISSAYHELLKHMPEETDN